MWGESIGLLEVNALDQNENVIGGTLFERNGQGKVHTQYCIQSTLPCQYT